MSSNKDVIYIDIEDDITAIIGKIKAGKERIAALVPPKRTGILQSAVNLRLLSRMAETSNKKLVIVTTNKALIALSAAAMIPIAKNLQSKPELAEVEDIVIDESDDVIDGSQIPIGELANATDEQPKQTADDAIETINIEELDAVTDKNPKPQKASPANSVKIPDFTSFRKKLFLSIIIIVAFTTFMVWAIKYAPFASVTVTTNTTLAPVSATVKLSGAEATNVLKNNIQTVTKQTKKDVSVEFSATGTKDNGTKASGAVILTIDNMQASKIPIYAGERIKFGDKLFIVQNDIIIAGAVDGVGSGSGIVIAAANGESFNVAPGSSCSVVGNNNIDCGTTLGMGGGTTSVVTIVTAADVQKASQTIVDMPTVTEKVQLTKQFVNDEKVIPESFFVERAAAVSVPAIGEEVTGKAKLTSATTYSLTAVAKSELQSFLRKSVDKQIINSKIQRVYDDGLKNVVLSGYLRTDQATTINVSATGKIGPSIDEAYVYNIVKGKQFGDIQATLEQIDGVESVEVKFSYFWVSTVPTEKNKVDIKFEFADAKSK